MDGKYCLDGRGTMVKLPDNPGAEFREERREVDRFPVSLGRTEFRTPVDRGGCVLKWSYGMEADLAGECEYCRMD